ncbi:MAG: hypothetical protein IID08_01670 [Candidatus Hydrogenedentes bacterium]|nr:hypothetical protein [Candidatus Hydrogenedentota bacterium]
MYESSIDEFEALFERASIPVFDLPHVALKSIAFVPDGSDVDRSCVALLGSLKNRFDAEVQVYRDPCVDPEYTAALATAHSFKVAGESYLTPKELTAALNKGGHDLILLTESDTSESHAATLDELVQHAHVPVLVVRTPIEAPEDVFTKVLHSMTGNLESINHLAYSFSLVEDGGALMLLHTVEHTELEDLRDTLRVSKEVAARDGEALLEDLKHHAERYLKGVVASARDEPYAVDYHLRIGDAITAVERELRIGHSTLLVVGTHHEGSSHVDALEYQLMHRVSAIPVLAL